MTTYNSIGNAFSKQALYAWQDNYEAFNSLKLTDL